MNLKKVENKRITIIGRLTIALGAIVMIAPLGFAEIFEHYTGLLGLGLIFAGASILKMRKDQLN